MNPLEIVIAHLRRITPEFYGQIVIRFKDGTPVHMSEERSIKIEEKTSQAPLEENVRV